MSRPNIAVRASGPKLFIAIEPDDFKSRQARLFVEQRRF